MCDNTVQHSSQNKILKTQPPMWFKYSAIFGICVFTGYIVGKFGFHKLLYSGKYSHKLKQLPHKDLINDGYSQDIGHHNICKKRKIQSISITHNPRVSNYNTLPTVCEVLDDTVLEDKVLEETIQYINNSSYTDEDVYTHPAMLLATNELK